MATTTWAGASGIRDDLTGELRALTPTSLADKKFDLAPTRYMLRDWAAKNPGACFRRLQMWTDGYEELEPFDPSEYEVRESVTLAVAYPATPAFYGENEWYDAERIIEEDVYLLRDTIFKSSNYSAGVNLRQVTGVSIERGEGVWVAVISITLNYRRTQSL